MNEQEQQDRLITGKETSGIASYSKRTLKRMVARKEFPPPVIEKANDCRWSYAEVSAWVRAQKEKRDQRIAASGTGAPAHT